MRRVVGLTAVILLAVAVGVASVVAYERMNDGPDYQVAADTGTADHDFVIPAGTSDRLLRHEKVDILPRRLDVTVGETIRIRNQDTRGQLVGIFYVGAGETVRMRFTSPGELSGACEVHPDGQFTIMVHEA